MSDLVLTKEAPPALTPTGTTSVYAKTDGRLYQRDGDTQIETLLTPGSVVIVQDKTYAELETLVAGNALISGMKYRVNDFQTVHTIPGTADTNTGPIEPLIVTATSTNTFDDRVTSEQHAWDNIEYEFVDTAGFGGTKGRITRRDNNSGDGSIDCDYDWRNVKFRKWLDPVSGQYVVNNDNGQAHQDVYTFNPTSEYHGIKIRGVDDGPGSKSLNAIVFYDNARLLVFERNTHGNVYCGDASDFNCLGDNQDNTFFSPVANSIAFNNFNGNTFANPGNEQVGYCTFGNDFQNNNCQGVLDHVTFGNNVNGLSIFGRLTNVLVSDGYSNHTINGTLTNCTILGDYTKDIVGDYTNVVFSEEKIIPATTNITASVTDDILVCNGVLTVTLPDATTAYKRLTVKNTGTGNVTISCSVGQTIDGQTSVVLNDQFESLTLAPFGATWLLI